MARDRTKRPRLPEPAPELLPPRPGELDRPARNGKTGRFSKLTGEAQDKLVKVIAAGNYDEVACAFAGISQGTLYRWLERGRIDAEAGVATEYREFRDRIARARSEALVSALVRIRNAGDKDWRAEAWFLERRYPHLFGPSQTVRVEGETQRSYELDLTKLSDAELEQLDAMVSKATVEGESVPSNGNGSSKTLIVPTTSSTPGGETIQ